MPHTTTPGNIFASFQGRPISQWETHDGENKASRTTPHLRPAPSKTEGSGTWKFNGLRLAGGEGWAVRLRLVLIFIVLQLNVHQCVRKGRDPVVRTPLPFVFGPAFCGLNF
jgi:hypothetical protein